MTLKPSHIIIAIAVLSLSSCTVYLPPKDDTVPSAEPLVIPSKNTVTDSKNKNQVKTPATSSKTKTTVPEIKATNEADSKSKTTVENKAATPPKTSNQGQTFYIVKPKDTVFAVMRNTGVHWKKIIQLNNLKAPKYTIFPGQSLRIK